MKKITNSNRRSFLTSSAAIAGVAAISSISNFNINIAKADHTSPTPKATPEYIKWKNRNALIIHSEGTIETHRDMIGNGIITPIENVYIRNNVNSLNDQQIGNRPDWKLEVQGVQKPKTFTLAELQKMPLKITPMVLQCSGNGRKFFAHGPSGTKWDTGSAACVTFSGVSVKHLVELCGGLAAGAKFITGTGADAPKEIDPKEGAVERSVPISTYEDCLLAWEVNGVPIQNAHGGPLRLVVPGYYGINNIKHVNKLVFADKESDFKMMSTRYRVYKIGNKATANDGTCWEMNVKSWITTPLTTAKTGKVVFTGVAFSNGTPLKGVALSFDEGKNWKAAKFVGPNLGKFAWRQFQFEANLEKGNYTVASRATDEKGSQPKLRFENNEGYSHNGWLDHSVKITVA